MMELQRRFFRSSTVVYSPFNRPRNTVHSNIMKPKGVFFPKGKSEVKWVVKKSTGPTANECIVYVIYWYLNSVQDQVMHTEYTLHHHGKVSSQRKYSYNHLSQIQIPHSTFWFIFSFSVHQSVEFASFQPVIRLLQINSNYKLKICGWSFS